MLTSWNCMDMFRNAYDDPELKTKKDPLLAIQGVVKNIWENRKL